MNVAELRALGKARAALHGEDAPRWMEGVLATAVGPKIVDGQPSDDYAIHLVVPSKLKKLTRAQKIPAEFKGFQTDVIDAGSGEFEMGAAPVPASLPAVGYGTPLLTGDGTWGTAACAGYSRANEPILITSAHVVGLDEVVDLRDGGSAGMRLGTCKGRRETMSRRELYGDRGSAPSGTFSVDVAAIVVEEGVALAGGMPGRHPFFVGLDSAVIDRIITKDTRLITWGSASRTWRQGRVVSFWPRRRDEDVYGLCLVQQSPASIQGDSGSLWLAYFDNEYHALGLHWGLGQDGDSTHAIVTDGMAAFPALGVTKILTQP
jgi:hypothetical protein